MLSLHILQTEVVTSYRRLSFGVKITMYPTFPNLYSPPTLVTQPVLPASLVKHPQQWTKDEVGVWLLWCVEEYSIAAVPPDKFDMNGKAVCLLSRSDFMERVPMNGDVLYNALQKLVDRATAGSICQQLTAVSPMLPVSSASYPHTCVSRTVTDSVSPSLLLLSTPTTQPSYCQSKVRPLIPILPQPDHISGLGTHQDVNSPAAPLASLNSPSAPSGVLSPAPSAADTESAASHSDSEAPTDVEHANGQDMGLSLERSSVFDRPGAASNESNHAIQGFPTSYKKHDSDCRLLWEFIHQLLQNPKYRNYVCWEKPEEYVFRIVNPTGLAELWGRQKNRTNMTYEKLSRALRYYYRMNIIIKVQGKRLTYKFLQAPTTIQKGQRGARPHSRLSTTYKSELTGESNYCEADIENQCELDNLSNFTQGSTEHFNMDLYHLNECPHVVDVKTEKLQERNEIPGVSVKINDDENILFATSEKKSECPEQNKHKAVDVAYSTTRIHSPTELENSVTENEVDHIQKQCMDEKYSASTDRVISNVRSATSSPIGENSLKRRYSTSVKKESMHDAHEHSPVNSFPDDQCYLRERPFTRKTSTEARTNPIPAHGNFLAVKLEERRNSFNPDDSQTEPEDLSLKTLTKHRRDSCESGNDCIHSKRTRLLEGGAGENLPALLKYKRGREQHAS